MYAVDDDRILLSGKKHDRLVHRDGRVLQKFGGAMHQAVAADTRSAVLLSTDGILRIWNTETNRLSKTISAGPERRIDRVISATGRQVVTMVSEGSLEPIYSVATWDSKTGAEIRKTENLRGRVVDMDSSPNRFALLTASNGDYAVAVRDIATSAEFTKISVANSLGAANCVAISADSSQIAVGYSDGVAIYELDSSGSITERQEFSSDSVAISVIAFSPSGQRIVTGHENGNVALWHFSFASPQTDQETRWDKLINLRKLHRTRVHTLQFSQQSPASLLTADQNGVAVRFARNADESL